MILTKKNLHTKINRAGKIFCTPDWQWDTGKHNNQDFDLWNVLQGHGQMKTPKKEYNLLPGDCFLLDLKQEQYIGTHDPDNPLIVIYIHFDFIDNESNIIKPKNPPKLYRRIKDISFFESLLNRVLKFQNDISDINTTENIQHAEEWFNMVLLEIHHQDKQKQYSGLMKKYSNYVNRICNEIIKNPAKFQNVEMMAKQFSYSIDHFTRIFKKIRGITPYEFLLQTRIDTAKTLLRTSDHDISRIAELLGYSDLAHFSKQFNARVGMPPSTYRKADQPYF